MGVWYSDQPADTDQANTIHTILQTAKVDIMERMRAQNNNFDEHDFYGSGATGVHDTRTGFAKVWDTKAALDAAHSSSPYPDGSLHVVKTSDPDGGLYIVYGGALQYLSAADHGALEGLTDDDHTQYFRKDGSRTMNADVSMSSSGITPAAQADSDDGDALLASPHVSQSWYDAHGAGSIMNRHITDGTFVGMNAGVEDDGEQGTTYPTQYYASNYQEFRFFPVVYFTHTDPWYVRFVGGHPGSSDYNWVFLWHSIASYYPMIQRSENVLEETRGTL